VERNDNKQGELKQLYFLHIPKTAGKYVSENIKRSLDANDISYYISTHHPNNNNFAKKVYTAMHAGRYPIDVVPDIDVATIIRNPVEARVSYFNFLHNRALFSRKEYLERESPLDKLRYYLFEDPNFELHNNYQSRFICNSADSRAFSPLDFYTNHYEELMSPFLKRGEAFSWFIDNTNTSKENALKAIKDFKIVNSLDRIDLFEKNINNWFNANYNVEIEFNKDNIVNAGIFSYGNEEGITTEHLVSLLSESEIDLILKNNDIDYFIYNYVKDNETIELL
jgi:hypothetical protein